MAHPGPPLESPLGPDPSLKRAPHHVHVFSYMCDKFVPLSPIDPWWSISTTLRTTDLVKSKAKGSRVGGRSAGGASVPARVLIC